MTDFLRWNSAAYRNLLTVYPEEFRREYAPELSLVFAEDLADAWSERGAAGACQVWWCALGEVVRIALPGQWSNPAVSVPATAFALTVAMLGAEWVGVLRLHPSTASFGSLLRDAIGPLLLFSSADALVAFVVVLLSRFNPPVSLSLASAHENVGAKGSAGRA